MNGVSLLLRLPAGIQRALFELALRTAGLGRLPHLGMLVRYFRLLGADEGEFLRTVSRIRSWSAWPERWRETAGQALEEARAQEAAGHPVTARDRYRQAALYFALANWRTWDARERARTYEQLLAAYGGFARLVDPPARSVDIPFAPAPLPGYLRLPRGPGPHPVVVVVQGMDTVKEVCPVLVEQPLLERGLATLTVDQPGTGEAQLRGVLFVGPEMLAGAARAIADFVASCPELDAARLGIIGFSWGGFVAPYMAAAEPRVRAGAILSALWEFPEPERAVRTPFYGPSLRLMTGIEEPTELVALLRRVRLEPVAARIRCPLCIVHGEQDAIVPVEFARRLYDAVSGPRLLHIIPGADHAASLHLTHLALLGDWLADHLRAEKDTRTHRSTACPGRFPPAGTRPRPAYRAGDGRTPRARRSPARPGR
ncbi:alpha/beta fold hydrolase [Carboxydochorda subterranea]|uniref:Alpha/beta fold hydrolase n=1 Tax=Carboxydichorda subterranea TaxID=3109565 RepID=A0ABZ1BZS9_9FIRM|nr:alpha/beta fold hydrolase [Limnochorda sp. L945t]WRP18090.1 alpha/beta fold hydrolase [Limnochorda sp. L945t]